MALQYGIRRYEEVSRYYDVGQSQERLLNDFQKTPPRNIVRISLGLGNHQVINPISQDLAKIIWDNNLDVRVRFSPMISVDDSGYNAFLEFLRCGLLKGYMNVMMHSSHYQIFGDDQLWKEDGMHRPGDVKRFGKVVSNKLFVSKYVYDFDSLNQFGPIAELDDGNSIMKIKDGELERRLEGFSNKKNFYNSSRKDLCN